MEEEGKKGTKRTGRITRLQRKRTKQQMHKHNIPLLTRRIRKLRRRKPPCVNKSGVYIMQHVSPHLAYSVYLVEPTQAGITEWVGGSACSNIMARFQPEGKKHTGW